MQGDIFRKQFKIDLKLKDGIHSYINEIYFTEMEVNERFILNGGETNVTKLTIPFTTKFKGVIKFYNCTFLESNLSGVNEHAKLIFKKVEFKSLNINDFSNLNDMTFSNSGGTTGSSFNIIDSDLGQTKFNDFSFKSFDKIKVENAFFNNIVCSNIIWFDEKQIVNTTSTNDSKFHKNKRELYRQLKQALKSNGNIIDSLEFQAKELKSYRNELKKSKKYSFGDRLIMIVNMTNDYGLNWVKPTLIILLITLIFFPLLSVLKSDELLFSFSAKSADIKKTLHYLWIDNKLYIDLLNPARRVSDVYGIYGISNWIYWIDSVQRVFLGLFIFQIIKAFRKFVLK